MNIALAVLGCLEAFARAYPAIKETIDGWVAAWVEKRINDMKAENREAIKRAAITHDQRPIEEIIGSPTAGEPSGIPGAVIVDGPPPRK